MSYSHTVQSVSQANLGLESKESKESKESADDVEVSVINSDANNEQMDPLLPTGGHGKDESKIYDKDEHQSRAFKNNDGDRRSDSKKGIMSGDILRGIKVVFGTKRYTLFLFTVFSIFFYHILLTFCLKRKVFKFVLKAGKDGLWRTW